MRDSKLKCQDWKDPPLFEIEDLPLFETEEPPLFDTEGHPLSETDDPRLFKGEEALLEDFGERFRQIAQSPDGYLYVLVDGLEASIYRIEVAKN